MRTDSQTAPFQLDIPYTDSVHIAQFPGTMAREAMLSGQRPPTLAEPYVYCDMGCGTGATLLTLAAANPHARFFGVDLNPAHIAHATAACDSAGIENATFLCGSFAEAQATEVPPCDFISAHGILSWIPVEAEAELFAAAAALLKPGGLFQASANMLPGWAQMIPVREMMLDVIRNSPGENLAGLHRAIQTAVVLCQSDQPFSQRNPDAVRLVEGWKNAEASYVAHEILGSDWRLFTVGDILGKALEHGLECCGPVQHVSPAAQAFKDAFCRDIEDPFVLESLLSHTGGENFRSLVFVKPDTEGFTRGSLSINGNEVIGFPSLARWTDQPGETSLPETARELDEHPLSIASVMDHLIAAGDDPMEELHDVTTMLGRSLATRASIPYVSLARDVQIEADTPIRTCHPLTADVLDKPRTYRFGGHVPSPVMGGGLRIDPEIAALLKVRLDGEHDTVRKAQALMETMLPEAPPWAVDYPSRATPDPAEAVETFEKSWLPLLGRLGVVESAG